MHVCKDQAKPGHEHLLHAMMQVPVHSTLLVCAAAPNTVSSKHFVQWMFHSQTLLGGATCNEARGWGCHGSCTWWRWLGWQRRLLLLLLLGVAKLLLLLRRLLLLILVLVGELLLVVLHVGVGALQPCSKHEQQ
jgi:hypothetical protein